MSLRTQMQRLGLQSAAFRADVFGGDSAGTGDSQQMEYEANGTLFAGYFAPVKYARQLDGLNMQEVHDCIVRFSKSAVAFRPAIGGKLRLVAAAPSGADMLLRIDEFNDHPANPEWVLGCKQL